MKKKITASVVAFALALAVPTAAFASESVTAKAVDGKASIELKDDATTKGLEITNVKGDISVKTYNYEYDGQIGSDYQAAASDVLQAVLDKDKNNTTIKAAYNDYTRQCEKIVKDGGDCISAFVINGEVEKGKTATVSVYLDEYYGGKTVTYVILHEDGKIQKKTVKVNADGTVNINVTQFSAFSFFLTEGLEGYEAVPQDGAVSPKTGC
ncbi:hypothetical protein [Adlercreutzia sp. ZJ304]|uniref:hypothetical protein n=1 Tax=Adlercreutzia sp. ZJ304 TaxID=2709791 RepID=UPI0013ED4089|nr:hypothetical protein [Adlercreutzia sp. ZJ304]